MGEIVFPSSEGGVFSPKGPVLSLLKGLADLWKFLVKRAIPLHPMYREYLPQIIQKEYAGKED